MKQAIRGFATAAPKPAAGSTRARTPRTTRRPSRDQNAPPRRAPRAEPAPEYPTIFDVPLSKPRMQKSTTPCGTRAADAFFTFAAGHHLTQEELWSAKQHTRFIMPPKKDGQQDPGSYWPDVVTDPAKLKGIPQHAGGPGAKRGKAIVTITDFSAHYLSPWTVQGVLRKSRPAIALFFHSFLPLNGHNVKEDNELGYAPPGKPTSSGQPLKDQRNPCPLTSAVHRSITAKLYRRIFLEEFHKIDGACDGVYVFAVRKVPENEYHIRFNMAKVIKTVAEDWKTKKSLFQTDRSDKVEKALHHQKLAEPLSPELVEVRQFDPVVVKLGNEN